MYQYLDQKTCQLLAVLLVQQEPLTVGKLAEQAQLSRRMVYYHLEKINDALTQGGLSVVENIPRLGVQLSTVQADYLSQLMEQPKQHRYVWNTEERQLLLLFTICVSAQRVTLEQLIHITMTSRNTVLNDIAAIREYLTLNGHQVTLNVSKKRGYYFSGELLAIVSFIYALLVQTFQSHNDVFVETLLAQLTTDDLTQKLFASEFREAVAAELRKQEKVFGKTLVEKDVALLVRFWPFYLLALRNGTITLSTTHEQQSLNDVLQRVEYRVAMHVLLSVSVQFQLEIPVEAVQMLSILLLVVRKNEDMHNASADYDDLRLDVCRLIDLFESRSGIVFNQREGLCDRLMTHLKTLLYRKKYNIFTANPLLPVIREQYRDIFALTKLTIPIFEAAQGIRLSEDEVAYVAMHFGGALKNAEQQVLYNRVAIVTDEGQGIRELLRKQCEQYIPRLRLIGMVAREEELAALGDIDFVVTTLPELATACPYVVVKPIFGTEDVIRLLKIATGLLSHEAQKHLEQRIATILAAYIPERTQQQRAAHEIQHAIDEQFAGQHNVRPQARRLHQVMTPERYQVRKHVADWDAAIDLLAQPLLAQHTVSPTYIAATKKEVAQRGLYMALAPEVLLFHSHYEQGVTQADVSVLYVEQPIVADHHRAFRVFLLLVTDEHMQHVTLMSDIDKLLQAGLVQQLAQNPQFDAFQQFLQKVLQQP